MVDLFFSKKNKKYYYTGNEICESCGDGITNLIILRLGFSMTERLQNCFCMGCVDSAKAFKPKILEKYSEIKFAIIADNLPRDAYPIFFDKPSLKISKSTTSIFGAANLESDKVVDRTRLAGRFSFEDLQITDMEKVECIESQDQLFLTPRDVSDFLKSQIPVLEYQDQNLLGCGE